MTLKKYLDANGSLLQVVMLDNRLSDGDVPAINFPPRQSSHATSRSTAIRENDEKVHGNDVRERLRQTNKWNDGRAALILCRQVNKPLQLPQSEEGTMGEFYWELRRLAEPEEVRQQWLTCLLRNGIKIMDKEKRVISPIESYFSWSGKSVEGSSHRLALSWISTSYWHILFSKKKKSNSSDTFIKTCQDSD